MTTVLMPAADRNTGVIQEDPATDAALVPSYLVKELVSNVKVLGMLVDSFANWSVTLDTALVDGQRPRLDPNINDLKPRELAVLSLMAQGFSNCAIADRLGLQPKTVQNYINYIYQTLNVTNDNHVNPRVQAVLDYIDYTSAGRLNGIGAPAM